MLCPGLGLAQLRDLDQLGDGDPIGNVRRPPYPMPAVDRCGLALWGYFGLPGLTISTP